MVGVDIVVVVEEEVMINRRSNALGLFPTSLDVSYEVRFLARMVGTFSSTCLSTVITLNSSGMASIDSEISGRGMASIEALGFSEEMLELVGSVEMGTISSTSTKSSSLSFPLSI